MSGLTYNIDGEIWISLYDLIDTSSGHPDFSRKAVFDALVDQYFDEDEPEDLEIVFV